MKSFFLTLVAVLICLNFVSPSPAYSSGGDIGGGGSLREIQSAFQLEPEQIQFLRSQGNPNAAYFVWLQKMDPATRDRILNNVFRYHIVPQLKSQP